MTNLELFHLVADAASGRVRKRITERGLRNVSFRNVHFDSHRDALKALGGGEIPAIWDGNTLHVGEAACLALLDQQPAP